MASPGYQHCANCERMIVKNQVCCGYGNPHADPRGYGYGVGMGIPMRIPVGMGMAWVK